MNWDSASAFFAMGGRGFFIWGAYGLSFFLLAVELWQLSRRRKTSLKQLIRLQKLEDEQ
jgi:heme exporter protein D